MSICRILILISTIIAIVWLFFILITNPKIFLYGNYPITCKLEELELRIERLEAIECKKK